MKKRIFALLLTGLVIFSFTACKEEGKVENHFGDISSNKYTSAILGVEVEFEEDWIVYSENEILESNGYSADDVITETDIKVGDSLTELLAYDIDSQDSVVIYSEKIESEADIDTEALADDEKSEQEEYLSSCDYTNIETEVTSEKIFGEDRTCLNISAELEGEKIMFSYVYVQTDNYLLTFSLSSDTDEGVDNIISLFELK